MAALVALIAFGLVAIYSATKGLTATRGDEFYCVKRQLLAAAIGFAAMGFVLRLDYRHVVRLSRLFYVSTLLLHLAVLVAGRLSQGAVRWLSLGPLNVQPAELVKISLILVLAWELADSEKLQHWRGLIPA